MKNKLFVILVMLALLTVALVTGFTLVWRLFILGLLALTTGFLWAFLASRGIQADVKSLPDRCQVGDTIDEEVAISSRSRLPKLSLRIETNAGIPNHGNTTVFSLAPNGSFVWPNRISFQRRGQYRLGTYTITASDPLGFFQRQTHLGTPQEILVCPQTIDLPHFDPLAYHAYGYGSKGKLAGQMSTNVATVREYTNGDSLKHLHWRTTAHSGKLMVKLFDPDHSRNTTRNAWIILDMEKSAYASETTQEQAITIATSLIKKYMNTGSAVGLIANTVRNHFFTPEWGVQPFWNMLTTLALVQADSTTPVEQILTNEAIRFTGDAVVIVITPSRSERLSTVLRQLTGREGLVVAIVLDAETVSRSFVLSGAQVYTVKKDDDIAAALNSRRTRPIWNALEPQAIGVEN